MRLFFAAAALISLTCVTCVAGAADAPGTFGEAFPGLLQGSLATATFGQLPEGVLAKYRGGEITRKEVDDLVAKAPAERRKALERGAIFLVQELMTKRLLVQAASAAAGKPVDAKGEAKVIARFLQDLAANVEVTDDEVAAYYQAHPEMFDGDSLKKVRKSLHAFIRKQRRQAVVDAYVRDLGKNWNVVLAEGWAREQGVSAGDNPLDQARRSGMPTMVEFVTTNCDGCEKMKPILKSLGEKYEGRVQIVEVMAPDYPLLATRYGVTMAPTQVFFDAKGVEVNRHDGFFPKDEIEKEFARLAATE
jgi:thioredoxin 1